MEREVDTSERSQGDAAEGAQPAAATPGEVDDRAAATPVKWNMFVVFVSHYK